MGRSIEQFLSFGSFLIFGNSTITQQSCWTTNNSPQDLSRTKGVTTGSPVDGRNRVGVWGAALSLLSMALISFSPGMLWAATITVASCTRVDIQAQIDNASNGDTVIVPSGTCGWDTSALTVNKAITLQGSGIGKTIIQDNYTDTTPDITVTAVPNQVTRIAGFTFQGGTRTGAPGKSFIQVIGSNSDGSKVRIDHNKFDQPNVLRHIFVHGAIGVSDHNTFISRPGTNQLTHYIDHQPWNGNQYGDGAWTEGAQWGTDRFWFIEDNTITYGTVFNLIDSAGGARWVFRYNTVTNSRLVAHGTESTGRARGTRAIEVYNNTFTGPGSSTEMFELRSGSCVLHDNAYFNWGQYLTGVATLKTFRAIDAFSPWGGANGKNLWDTNQSELPLASGMHNGSSGVFGLTDATMNWTPNQWSGYTLNNITQGTFSQIDSNTATTITYKRALFKIMTFNNGDSYQIYKVNVILDQPGMGAGTLLSGSVPTPPSGGYTQVADPCYQWNNLYGARSLTFATAYKNIRSNEHFFNNTQPPGYVPYTHPHPLVTDSDNSTPAAPLGLSVQ